MSEEKPTPPRRFVETDWGLVGRAACRGEGKREALGVLLLRYLPALRAAATRRRSQLSFSSNSINTPFIDEGCTKAIR